MPRLRQVPLIDATPNVPSLSYAIATYRLHATLTRALRLEYDVIDERVTEIPIPCATTSTGIMSQISQRD